MIDRRARIVSDAVEGSQAPCDCWDCGGKWCEWCLVHHEGKPCPFVEAVKEELPAVLKGDKS